MLPALSLLCSEPPAAKSMSNKRPNSSKRKQNHAVLFRVFVLSATLVAILPFLLVSTHLSPALDMTSISDQNGVAGAKVKKEDSVPRTSGHASKKRGSSNNNNNNAGAIVLPTTHENGNEITGNCALCFFGLPRSFKLLVLPSIVKNVLIPNMANQCDVFFHYYHVKRESGGGRSGHGGKIDPNSIAQGLRQAVHDAYADSNSDIPVPHVSITNDTDESFWNARRTSLEKYRTAKDAKGKYLYFPWMAKTFKYPTSMDNIVKQWHSIDAVWNDMEETGKQLGRNYTRVAMLRNDVMYVTPFDIYRRDCSTSPYSPSTASSWDLHNQYAIVPNWARFPINDRMIYGPHEAVKIWATQRFRLLEEHVVTYPEPGYGMHSERFLEHSIFPAIRNLSGVSVTANPDICFFRARADGSVWNADCATRDGAARNFRYRKDIRQLVESISGGSCQEGKLGKVPLLLCHDQDDDGELQNLTEVSTQRV